MTATLTNWKTNIVDRIDGGEKSFRVSLKIFGEALTRSRGGTGRKTSPQLLLNVFLKRHLPM